MNKHSYVSPIKNRQGSALPVVLFFCAFAVITASIYLYTQTNTIRPAIQQLNTVQALCNARSGIWKALEMMNDSVGNDTLAGLDATDSSFGGDLFNDTDETISALDGQLLPDGGVIEVDLFQSDSFGKCEIELQSSGISRKLISVGIFHEQAQQVSATLGGKLFTSSDTTLYLVNADKPAGGNLGGEFKKVDPMDLLLKAVRRNELNELITFYQQKLISGDTLIRDMPLTIQSNDELSKIPETVSGPLFIDGQMNDIVWREQRTISVLGDLQFTGVTELENIEFIVNGEVKIFDQAQFKNVAIFCQSKVTIGNDAVFNGNLVTLGNIVVYNDACIVDKSIFVSRTNNKEPKKGESVIFSVTFSEQASFDGTLIALHHKKGKYSLKTEQNVLLQGLIWADGYICHQGICKGIMKAKRLVDCFSEEFNLSNPMGNQPNRTGNRQAPVPTVEPANVLLGTIEPFINVSQYYFPFFMGDLSIITWKEGMLRGEMETSEY